MPSLATTMMNAVPRLILRCPAHRILSGRYVVVQFTGRNTGRAYSTPVAYVQHGQRLLMSTDSLWWRNVDGRAPVSVRLRGVCQAGVGSRVPGTAAVEALRQLARIPGYPAAAGMRGEHRTVPESEIVRAAGQRVVLAIDPGYAS